MDRARYLVDAVVVEGRSLRDVARAHGVSKVGLPSLSSVTASAARLMRHRELPPTQTGTTSGNSICRVSTGSP